MDTLRKALAAFWRHLWERDCRHTRVHPSLGGERCPDCGYRIRLTWASIKCRECGAKRVPRPAGDGPMVPVDRCCRHCGSSAYLLVKKDRIEAHELLYHLSQREIDYREEPVQPAAPPSGPLSPTGQHLDIVEGEVIRRQVVTPSPRPPWQDAPFTWQPSVSAGYPPPQPGR